MKATIFILLFTACSDPKADPIVKATAEAMAAATKKQPEAPKPRIDRFIDKTIKRVDPNAKCEEWDGPDTRMCDVGGGVQLLWCTAKAGERPHCEMSFDLSPYMQQAKPAAQPAKAGKK